MRRFDELPDMAMLSDKETADILGFSPDTLARMDARGEGPQPRVQISPRRFGRAVGVVKSWLAKRSAEAAAATERDTAA